MLRTLIEKIMFYLQVVLLHISFYIYKYIYAQEKKIWVIGTHEIASNIYFLGKILDNSVTVSLSSNKFYDLDYTYSLSIKNKYFHYLFSAFYAPILLGKLVNSNQNFLYIWHIGFLFNRDYEFNFLKSKNKKIVCMFVGDDIRSPILSLQLSKNMKVDNFIEYVAINKYYLSKKYDEEKRKIALSADTYADLIFSFKLDQVSYLKSKQVPFTYMYPKENFFKNNKKFEKIKKIKILHAPSSPLVKGTPLVRAAIKKLEENGYVFEYVELQNMSNEIVIEHLKSSHIVLNQFYGFDISLGLFAVEAMASHTALLMSYDPSATKLYNIKLDGFDQCCFNTKYWNIYDNLKYLLDNPEKIKYYADKGYKFTHKYYAFDAAGKYINKVFKENGII